MYYIEAPGALPIKGYGPFDTFDEATRAVNSGIYLPVVYYPENAGQIIFLKGVKWRDDKLYHGSIRLDLAFCFNTQDEAKRFKRRFKKESLKLWRTMRCGT